MTLHIQRPATIDVTKVNPVGSLYVNSVDPLPTVAADNLPDGSIRIVVSSDGLGGKPELKASGVWNPTTWEIAGATLLVGRDLRMGAAGDWIFTTDVQQDHQSLIPHIEFTSTGGSFPYAHVPILSPLQENVPIQPDFSSEVITSLYTDDNVNPAELLATKTKYKTGSVAATEQVTISYERPAGTVFWTRNFPASRFTANTDVTIELEGLVEGFAGEIIRTEIKSDAPFSLKSNLSGAAYLLVDFYLLTEENSMTFETGLDLIATDEFGEVSVDEAGNLMTGIL